MLVKRTVSMPQDQEGQGCTTEFRQKVVWVHKAKLALLSGCRPRNTSEEVEHQSDKLATFEEKLREEATGKRRDRLHTWREWLRTCWKTGQGRSTVGTKAAVR